jgi:hypothetical protein
VGLAFRRAIIRSMSSITHWRLYLPCPVGEQASDFLVISEQVAKQLISSMAGGQTTQPQAVVTGGSPNLSSRTLYVNLSQVVALEPRED